MFYLDRSLAKKVRFVLYWIILGVYIIFLRNSLSFNLSILLVFLGLLIAIESADIAVEGMDRLAQKYGLTPYVAGVLSSLASNTPELVIGGISVLIGKTEFAIALVTVSTGFNILMLGVLVMLGNRIRKGPIILPQEVIDVEIPIMRVAIVILGSIFVIGIVTFVLEIYNIVKTSTPVIVPRLPNEASFILVITYLFYLYFIIRHNLQHTNKSKEDTSSEKKISLEQHITTKRSNLFIFLLIAFVGIFLAGEMISTSVEYLANVGHIDEFVIAFIIGLSASIPEHFIALLAIKREGGIELGLGNLMAGAVQNLLFVIGTIGMISGLAAWFGIHTEINSIQGIPLVHQTSYGAVPFILVQFGLSWLLLYLIKSSIIDDRRLDSLEGFTIIIGQTFVFIIFLKGILGV